MVIAVNTRVLSGNTAISKLLIDHIESIAELHPEHEFILIAEKDFSIKNTGLKNVKKILLPQQSSSPLLWKLWYNYKLPSLVKKMGAAVLISADGVCSLRIKIPQCLIVNDLAFINYSEWYSKNYLRFIKSNTPLFLQKANTVLTYSTVLKNELVKIYSIDEGKIRVIPPAISSQFEMLSFEKKEKVKQQYTEGKEYFLFSGIIHPRSNLVNLLKGFSIFKKRQKSNMQLMIASSTVPQDAAFMESLQLYKYKSEVKLLTDIEDKTLAAVTASAYACINLSVLQNEVSGLLNALKCEVPVIAGNLHNAIEVLGDAALYVSASNPESIADRLMLLYKDENKRNDLVKKGVTQSKKYTQPTAADVLWQNILATIPPE